MPDNSRAHKNQMRSGSTGGAKAKNFEVGGAGKGIRMPKNFPSGGKGSAKAKNFP